MLVLLSGVSGAGKDTIKNEIIKRMQGVESLPSYTTRPLRPGEIEGVTYCSVSKEQFEIMINNGDFYEYNEHHGNYYGTSKRLINEKIEKGNVILKDIEVNGVENLLKILGKDQKIVTIFLRVPKEVLRKRLQERLVGTTTEEIEMRLSRFEYEESKMSMYDYVLKNNDLEKTLQIIQIIIENEHHIQQTEF